MKKILAALILTITFAYSLPLQAEETYHRSDAQKGVCTATDVVAIAMPVATLAGVLIERDWNGLVQGTYTAALTAGATVLLKYTVHEQRPDKSNYHSFPSGHSAVTFATAAFVQRRYGWKLGAPAYALAAFTGWGRVYGKKHHWWDVVAGAAIGAGSAYIFTRPWAQQHSLSVSPMALIEPVTQTPLFGLSLSCNL